MGCVGKGRIELFRLAVEGCDKECNELARMDEEHGALEGGFSGLSWLFERARIHFPADGRHLRNRHRWRWQRRRALVWGRTDEPGK
ncbi:hypothetical protein [Pseudomonas syringae]|uniref:hypothetical protein n=1 Tax=Pseudomonas TaxID=286 RepID=UPI001F320864|nr:hypothetical protein [Pseudomonas syringae]